MKKKITWMDFHKTILEENIELFARESSLKISREILERQVVSKCFEIN